jgi:hypothetical protein
VRRREGRRGRPESGDGLSLPCQNRWESTVDPVGLRRGIEATWERLERGNLGEKERKSGGTEGVETRRAFGSG